MENQNTPPAGMPAQSSKAGLIGLSVALLVIGLIAGYAIGKRGSENVASQTVSPTLTASWETYRNTAGDYEFMHPQGHTPFVSEGYDYETKKEILVTANSESSDVYLAADTDARFQFGTEPFLLSFSITRTNFSAKDLLAMELDQEQKSRIKETKFAGESAYEYRGAGNLGDVYRFLVIDRGTYKIEIEQNVEDPLLDQILTTFRFTK